MNLLSRRIGLLTLVALLMMCVFSCRTSLADDPTVTIIGTAPEAIGVGQELKVSLSAIINSPPASTQECSVEGPTWKWSPIGSGVTVTPSDSPSPTLYATFNQSGTQNFGVSLNLKYTSSCDPKVVDVSTSKSFNVKVVSASFDQSLVKTGFLKSGFYMTAAKTVTLYVSPASEVNKIDLKVNGSSAEIRNKQPLPGLGKITFEVWGIKETDENNPNGDTTISARHSQISSDLSQTKVVVVVPTYVQIPLVEEAGPVTGYNRVLDATTSPAVTDTPAGQVALVTSYARYPRLEVRDQFNNTLDSVYAGAKVTEYGGIPINQVVLADGFYSDAVSVLVLFGARPRGGAEAQAWPSQPTLPITPEYEDTQNQLIPVEIGGHVLRNKVNRIVTGKVPNIVNIAPGG